MSTQVILLERVEKLGQMGDVVSVKPGYARNFLLPQRKALRASKDNVAYFEAQRKHLEAENDKKKAEAQKIADKLKGLKVPLIRAASEAGQLYGSVAARDIAEIITEKSGVKVTRGQVDLNQNFKMVGLFDVPVILHPELKVDVTVNIARTQDEAEMQAETGKAVIGGEEEQASEPAEAVVDAESTDEQLEAVLEEDALEADKERKAEAEAKAAEDAAKAEVKAAAKAEKDAAKAAKAPAEEAPVENAMTAEVVAEDSEDA